MNFVRLIPVFVSFLFIAAHFQRAGSTIIAICCLLTPMVLLITRSWSVRLVQGSLLLASFEWLRTLISLVGIRQEAGMEWGRLAIILGTVALFTALCPFIFQHREIRKKFNIK